MTKHMRRKSWQGFTETSSIGNRLGFTLVELLIVIAVVTILVAILVPVTIQSRNRARTVVCLSNLRQLVGATLAYGQDWDEKLPSLNATPFAGSSSDSQWPDGSSATQFRTAISNYVRSSKVYKCGNDFGALEYGFDFSAGSVFSRTGSSYVPWSTARSGRYGVEVNGARTATLSPLSAHLLIRDYGSDWHGFRTRSGLDLEALTVANAAFADGHVAAVPVYRIAVSGRNYACAASGVKNNSGFVLVSGGSGDVKAELTGRRTINTGSAGQEEMRLSLSGVVSGGGTDYNVDRVFAFGTDTKMDTAFRQVVVWVDSQVAR